MNQIKLSNYILILFLLSLLWLSACKSGGSAISPILPDHVDTDQEANETASFYPISNKNSPPAIHLPGRGNKYFKKLGPDDYLSSTLNPPLIMERTPEFSVEITDNTQTHAKDGIYARIDNQFAPVIYSGDIISFKPNSPLMNGVHTAELRLVDNSGKLETCTWQFQTRTSLPKINTAFTRQDGSILIFFDDYIEPSILNNHSNWSLNGHSNVIDESQPILNLSNMIALIKMKPSVLETFRELGEAEIRVTSKIGSSGIKIYSSISKNNIPGNSDNIENKENEETTRYAQNCDPVDCDNYCSTVENVKFCFCNDGEPCGTGINCRHEPIENEDYAIVWELENPDDCLVELVCTNIYFQPVMNQNPESVPFTQTEDQWTYGTANILEGPFTSTISNESVGTMKFPPNWKIHMDWTCQATFCTESPIGCPHLYTVGVDGGSFDFDSALDQTNPDFADLLEYGISTFDYPNPVIMTGMELADYLDDIFIQIPLNDDPDFFTRSNVHCYSKSREIDLVGLNDGYPDQWGNYESGILWQLRNQYPCELFVFLAAEDKALDPNKHKCIFTSPAIEIAGTRDGIPFIEWFNFAHFHGSSMMGEPGWELEFHPWGAPTYYSDPRASWPTDYEIFTEWDDSTLKYEVVDIDDPECPGQGCPWFEGPWLAQDYRRPEIVIQWWNLSDILDSHMDDKDLDIRILIEDEVADPFMENCPPDCADYYYNWRKSENLMPLLIDKLQCVRSGSRHAQLDLAKTLGELFAENNEVNIKFIGKNPHADVNPEDWRIVNYSGDTDSIHTSFIYTRDSAGSVDIDLFIGIHMLEVFAEDEDMEQLVVSFETTEKVFPYVSPPAELNTPYANTVYGAAKLIGEVKDMKKNPDNPVTGFPGMTNSRLMFLMDADDECDYLYHTRLTVFDNKTEYENGQNSGAPTNPKIYISSSDHELSLGSDKADFVISISDDLCNGGKFGEVKYNSFEISNSQLRRGIGYRIPEKTTQKWYSFDDLITAGGFEIVTVKNVYRYTDVAFGHPFKIVDSNRPSLPVQSEADLLLFFGHGVVYQQEIQGILEGYNFPMLSNLSYPMNHENTDWNFQSYRHVMANNRPSGMINQYYNDYSYGFDFPDDWQWWGFENDKGNFWLKKTRSGDDPLFPEQRELRWLTLMACGQLSMDNQYQPALECAKLIHKGYVDSVCGFRRNLDIKVNWLIGSEKNPYLYGKGYNPFFRTFADKYGEKLNNILSNCYYDYYNTSHCYEKDWLYASDAIPQDHSVGAFMETAVELIGDTVRTNEGALGWSIDAAAAVAYDYENNKYCRWIIEERPSLEQLKDGKFYSRVITKQDLVDWGSPGTG